MLSISSMRYLKQKIIKEQYNKIYSHELAHKRAGGALAGPIVIEKDANGVPFAGHVNITVPPLDPENPKDTFNKANTVLKAALAPSDPSGQDLKVADIARKLIFKSKKQMDKNKREKNSLNYFA